MNKLSPGDMIYPVGSGNKFIPIWRNVSITNDIISVSSQDVDMFETEFVSGIGIILSSNRIINQFRDVEEYCFVLFKNFSAWLKGARIESDYERHDPTG